MAGFSSAPHRLRALEKLLQPSGVAIVVEISGTTTDEERRDNAAFLEAATKAGRDTVKIEIVFHPAAGSPSREEKIG